MILAAGASIRFGSPKQLAKISGKLMLQHVIDHCSAVPKTDLFLVLGANQQVIEPQLALSGVEVIPNPEWREGVASSIRIATRKIENSYGAILFIAGDQPLVRTEQLQQLVISWRNSNSSICAADYENTLGIPALFPVSCYQSLLNLTGDNGAKSLIAEQENRVCRVAMPEAAIDIDYPDDLPR